MHYLLFFTWLCSKSLHTHFVLLHIGACTTNSIWSMTLKLPRQRIIVALLALFTLRCLRISASCLWLFVALACSALLFCLLVLTCGLCFCFVLRVRCWFGGLCSAFGRAWCCSVALLLAGLACFSLLALCWLLVLCLLFVFCCLFALRCFVVPGCACVVPGGCLLVAACCCVFLGFCLHTPVMAAL